MSEQPKPVLFTRHARDRCAQRGTTEADVATAIRRGKREPAQRGLWLYRLNLEYQREWAGKRYAVQQVVPVVEEEADRFVGGDGLCVLLLKRGAGMRISYDKEADALYIQLLDGDFQCRAVRVTDDISLDFAAGEQLVGIEVLGASHLFKDPESPQVELKHLLPQVAA